VFEEEYIAAGDVVTLTLELRHSNMDAALPDDTPAPPAYAPYVASERPEEWVVFLLDHKEKLVTMRNIKGVRKVTIDKSITFLAPEKPGAYTYHAFVRSLTFMGLDQDVEVRRGGGVNSGQTSTLGGGGGGRTSAAAGLHASLASNRLSSSCSCVAPALSSSQTFCARAAITPP
jgi:hypothetical protein